MVKWYGSRFKLAFYPIISIIGSGVCFVFLSICFLSKHKELECSVTVCLLNMTVFEFLRSVTNSRKRTVETERHRVAEANKLTEQHADRARVVRWSHCRHLFTASHFVGTKCEYRHTWLVLLFPQRLTLCDVTFKSFPGGVVVLAQVLLRMLTYQHWTLAVKSFVLPRVSVF